MQISARIPSQTLLKPNQAPPTEQRPVTDMLVLLVRPALYVTYGLAAMV